jgi:hypothetical protein
MREITSRNYVVSVESFRDVLIRQLLRQLLRQL